MRTIADKYIDEGVQKGMVQGIQIGRSEGLQIGEAKKTMEVAKNLLAQNIDIKTISVATGLSIDEINKLKNS